jgi:16S rRNA (guanine527-N7)-methyltransferase
MGCQRAAQPGPQDLAAFRDRAAAVGAVLDDAMVAAFQRYFALLQRHGGAVNLTSVLDWEGVQRRHFLESLAVGSALQRRQRLQASASVIDVGAGAGFPGLPLRIALPHLRLTLLEATAKKAAFLEQVIKDTRLEDVAVVARRAEEAAQQPGLRECFDVVLARAVAPLPALAELTLPFARGGGIVAAVKGSRLDTELAESAHAIHLCGGRVLSVESLSATEYDKPAMRMVVLEKIRSTPSRFPRRPGLPAKQPLV